MWLMQNGMKNPDNAGAASNDYMHLFGLTALAFMWARIAKAALARQAAGTSDAALDSKLTLAKFFARAHAAGSGRLPRPAVERRGDVDGAAGGGVLSAAKREREDGRWREAPGLTGVASAAPALPARRRRRRRRLAACAGPRAVHGAGVRTPLTWTRARSELAIEPASAAAPLTSRLRPRRSRDESLDDSAAVANRHSRGPKRLDASNLPADCTWTTRPLGIRQHPDHDTERSAAPALEGETNMADAFIYDHVRTPRGRGKPDGALHTATTLHLAATALKAIKDRNELDSRPDRRRGDGLRRSGRRGGRRHRAHGRAGGGPRRRRARRADQPLLRFRPRLGQFRRGAGHVGPARADDRRRRRIDEPRRHRRLGRRLAGRSGDRDPRLFHAAGRLGRSDRDQIRLLARRRRRLCGRVAEARRARRGRKAGSSIRSCRCATSTACRCSTATSTCGPTTEHAVARGAEAVVRDDGRAGRLRRGGDPGASRKSSASITSTTPAIRPASSTARRRC